MNPLCRTLCLILLVTLFVISAHAADFNVVCGKTGLGLHSINAALAKVSEVAKHQEVGPNTITVTGACVENVSIVSLDNLTLQAGPSGASISDASGGALDTVLALDSSRFSMNGFTINGSVNCANNAVCRLFGNTIQNSQAGYGLRASRSHVDSVNDSIVNNPSGPGVISTNDSRVALQDDTISNNGGRGIQVTFDGFVVVTAANTVTTISNNAGHGIFAASHGTVRLTFANITGNAGDGIRIQDGSTLRTDFVGPSVNNISGNGGSGVNLGDLSHAWFAPDGSVSITGNLSGIDVYCAGQFAATRFVGTVGGTTNCVEPNPEAPTQRPQDKEKLKPF